MAKGSVFTGSPWAFGLVAAAINHPVDADRVRQPRPQSRRPILPPGYVAEEEYLYICTRGVAGCVPPGRTDLLRARKRLYERFGFESFGISDFLVE